MSDQQTARVARQLTQHERARVWERVVAERAKGDGWRDIAERAALSERQCRRIYLAYARSAPTLEPSVLEREIEETVAFYDQAISDLAVISMTARSEVDSGRGDQGAHRHARPEAGAAACRGRAGQRTQGGRCARGRERGRAGVRRVQRSGRCATRGAHSAAIWRTLARIIAPGAPRSSQEVAALRVFWLTAATAQSQARSARGRPPGTTSSVVMLAVFVPVSCGVRDGARASGRGDAGRPLTARPGS